MNITLDLPNINWIKTNRMTADDLFFSVFFTEKKPNIIMDGFFTKLVFSTDYFSVIGLCLTFYITRKPDIVPTTNNLYRHFVYLDPYTLENRKYAECACEMEEYILSMYSHTAPGKTPVYSLKTQLNTGVIKIHSEDSEAAGGSVSKYILKISGVWETAYAFGITYKFVNQDR